MRQRHNLLLLDEPTNHLDLDSREALEESLEEFPGSIVLVSHDRAFIDRLATRVLDIRGGRARLFDGNYSETAVARAERRKRPEAEFATGATPQSVVPSASRPPVRSRRVTSDQAKEVARRRRRIETLEEKIAACEKQIEGIEARLWEEGLDLGPVESHRLATEKAARREELEKLVEEWARLSEQEEPAGSTAP
jgi:ATP-binding cassette, subfamily F, member 3